MSIFPPDVESADAAMRSVTQEIEAAEEVRPRPLGPLSDTPPDVVPLGHAGGVYYFISKDGEQRHFSARELIRLNIASLFGGETFWLCDNFPCFNKKGDRIDGAFNANNAAEWLMRQCSTSGLFNPETPLRGLGVWRHREDVVAHLGGTIWHRGTQQPAGCVIGGAIYPARNKVQEPAFANPACRFDAMRIRQNLNAWAFTQEYDADLLFGYLGAALLGGFPHWRAHALVTGERGSGKSTLGDYLMRAIGAQGTSLNDYTEAGLRQTLTNEARTVWLDEGESVGEDQAHRMAKVIGLLRKMSGGVGARIARGTSGGVAMNTTVTGCVLLTAINPPPLQPQDKSRILTVPIDKPISGCSGEDMRIFLKEAADMSPRLRARALQGAGRFATTFDLFRKYLLAHGCDARQSDLFATLLAGRSLLLDDDVPSEDSARSYVAGMSRRLHLIMIDDSDASDGMSCLNRLLDAECAAIRDGIKRSIGQLVADGMHPINTPENDKLMPIGVRIIDVKGGACGDRMLFIANDHTGLKRIFHNTPWADGNWRSSLIRLAGVGVSPRPVSVGRKSRGVLIPKELLPRPDEGNEVDCSPSDPDPAPPARQPSS